MAREGSQLGLDVERILDLSDEHYQNVLGNL